MKTRIKAIPMIILLFSALPFIIQGQDAEEQFNKTYEWEDESETETIYVDIKKSSSTMLLNITGSVQKGTLKLKIYDPDGEKYPGFHLVSDGNSQVVISNVQTSTGTNTNTVTTTSGKGSSTSVSTSSSGSSSSSGISSGKGSSSKGNYYTYTSTSNDTGAKGVMNKVITDPSPGKWKFVITAKKLTGQLALNIDQE